MRIAFNQNFSYVQDYLTLALNRAFTRFEFMTFHEFLRVVFFYYMDQITGLYYLGKTVKARYGKDDIEILVFENIDMHAMDYLPNRWWRGSKFSTQLFPIPVASEIAELLHESTATMLEVEGIRYIQIETSVYRVCKNNLWWTSIVPHMHLDEDVETTIKRIKKHHYDEGSYCGKIVNGVVEFDPMEHADYMLQHM